MNEDAFYFSFVAAVVLFFFTLIWRVDRYNNMALEVEKTIQLDRSQKAYDAFTKWVER